MTPRIRIPTPDAPAAHHLTFICAVAELAHRVLENVTGLRVELRVAVHESSNVKRQPALIEAAQAAGLSYTDASDPTFSCAWHKWRPDSGRNVQVTVFGKPEPDYDAWNSAKDAEHYANLDGAARDADFQQAERDGWTAEQIIQREA